MLQDFGIPNTGSSDWTFSFELEMFWKKNLFPDYESSDGRTVGLQQTLVLKKSSNSRVSIMQSYNELHNPLCAINYCTSISTMLIVPLVYIIQCSDDNTMILCWRLGGISSRLILRWYKTKQSRHLEAKLCSAVRFSSVKKYYWLHSASRFHLHIRGCENWFQTTRNANVWYIIDNFGIAHL